MKPFIYMGYGVNKLIFGITGTEEPKLLQYADRVWEIVGGSEEERVNAAISKTRDFFESVGVRTRLSDYGVGLETIPAVINNLEKHGMTALGENKDVNLQAVEQILALCA